MSQRTLRQCALWRVAAFLFATDVHPKVLWENVLPHAYKRFCAKKIERLPKLAHSVVKQQTDVGTAFHTAVTSPSSFTAFEDAFDELLPLHVVSLLRSAMVVPAASPTPLSAVYLMHGVDAWMQSNTEEENTRIVLACGVSPAAVRDGLLLRPTACIDFAVDIMFPEGSAVWPATTSAAAESPASEDAVILDWLWQVVTQQLSHPVEEQQQQASSTSSAVQDRACCCDYESDASASFLWRWLVEAAPTRTPADAATDQILIDTEHHLKRARRNSSDRSTSVDSNNSSSSSNDNSDYIPEFLSEDNLESVMLSNPEMVPRDILRARRKRLTDPTITAFEVERHYTVAELAHEVENIASRITPSNLSATCSGSSAAHAGEVTPPPLFRGKRKHEIAEAVLSYVSAIRPLLDDVADRARGASQGEPSNSIIDVDMLTTSDDDDDKVGVGAALSSIKEDRDRRANGVIASIEIVVARCEGNEVTSNPSTFSSAELRKVVERDLIDGFTRADMELYLSVAHGATALQLKQLRTKRECAAMIIDRSVGSDRELLGES